MAGWRGVRREGWTVRETGRHDGPDGNIDLELTRGSDRKVVQCKRWTSQLVGVDDVRGFAGTLMREGLPGSAGIFVTLSSFREQARSEAETTGLTLIDCRDLYKRVEAVRRSEPCPVCGAPMVLGRSAAVGGSDAWRPVALASEISATILAVRSSS